jgi:diguanylate cyclase (GGDEF)-like protein
MVVWVDLVTTSQLNLSRRALGVYSRVLRSALDSADVATLVVDDQGQVLLSNRSFAHLAGLGPTYRLELGDLQAALASLGASVTKTEVGALLEPSAEPATLELPDDRTVLCTVTPMPMDGDGDFRLIELREITSDRRELRELERRALHDDLSGLPRRELLMDRLERALSRQTREGGAVGVAFIDLDEFKAINDRLGHAAGDSILIQVAARLQRELRAVDTVGRLGGDEFLVICVGLEGERALARICERMQQSIERPYRLDSEEVSLSASFGAVLEWDHSVAAAEVVERADTLMYAAKRRSSRRELFVDGRPPETIRKPREVRRPDGAHWLKEALEAGELFLAYLPIVTVDDQRTIAVEGLLRCRHPELESLPPGELLELVEEAGLMKPFGEWVMGEAARAARALIDATGAPVKVVVNVSETQLADNEVPGAVAKAAAEYDIDAGLLSFDIGERLVAANPGWLEASLAPLRELGCWLFVDDVGGPEVDVEQLRGLGFAGLKLDRPAIGRSADDAEFAITTKAAVTLARSLGLSVIGEGVDEEQRLHALLELGCDHAQGFGFFGFPRTLPELVKVMS